MFNHLYYILSRASFIIILLRPFCGENTQPITALTVKPGMGGKALISPASAPWPILRAKGRCLSGHRLYANGIMNNSRRNGRGREEGIIQNNIALLHDITCGSHRGECPRAMSISSTVI